MTDSVVSIVREALTAAGLACAGELRLVSHGRSGDLVALVGGVEPAVVKAARTAENRALLGREAAVLRWLEGRVRAPRALWEGRLGDVQALVTERIDGEAVSHVAPASAAEGLAATARAMAALHALPVADCPFDARLAAKTAEARRRTAAGLVDAGDFDEERRGLSAEAVLAQLDASLPAVEDLALTHGDASLPNFLWTPGGEVALIDLGRFGVADRHQDLALFLRSAKFNHPHVDAEAVLREHYPLAEVDEVRCAFYRLLDEFF